jgi:hexosaminidase
MELRPNPLIWGKMNHTVAGIPADKTAHVLGGQGNVWTEYMNTTDIVEYMAYPRAIALAEAMWSANDQREFAEFKQRLSAHTQRLDRMGVNYRKLD